MYLHTQYVCVATEKSSFRNEIMRCMLPGNNELHSRRSPQSPITPCVYTDTERRMVKGYHDDTQVHRTQQVCRSDENLRKKRGRNILYLQLHR